jgi:DNA polymerase-3 subunit alpha
MFTEGATVYITAKVRPRFQNSTQLDLKVSRIEYMQDVKDKAIDRITITMNTDELDDQIVAELSELIDEYPGSTKLFFRLRDSQGKHHVLLKSTNKTLDIRNNLINYIDEHSALDYQIN